MRAIISMPIAVLGALWFIVMYFYAPWTIFTFLVVQWKWYKIAAFAVAFFTAVPIISMILATAAAIMLYDWNVIYAAGSFFMWAPLVAAASLIRGPKAIA